MRALPSVDVAMTVQMQERTTAPISSLFSEATADRPPVATPSNATLERLRLSAKNIEDNSMNRWLTQDNLRNFFELFGQRNLSAVFQPILDLRSHRFLGYEGLIRGPAGTPLHSPAVLFGLAHESGLTIEFERLCREITLEQFASLAIPGRLFLNVSATCLADPRFINGDTARLLQSLRLRPGQIVIEITENEKISDFAALREILSCYRERGYQFAIDDLGEGFSNLRMWSEVRPEFVKIDQHFIRDIAGDPLKFRLVEAMRDIAEASHATLIAEGIETESEFTAMRDLGIHCGQGYLIARPNPVPPVHPTTEIASLLSRSGVIVFPRKNNQTGASVRQLLQIVDAVLPTMLNEHVFDRFELQPENNVLPVVRPDGTPIGLLNRYSLVDRFARPFRREIYGKRPCTQFMNADPICVDQDTPVQELGQLFGRAEHHQLLDGFIITENGRYLGIGSSQALMGLITDMQIRAARYANPLTQLPGNVPISEHIDRLLENSAEFVACYCDIDHFKPYNDSYGYRQGDHVIQLLGTLLVSQCDARSDFIGHVGGDDFILLMLSTDWESRCHAILAAFDAELPSLIAEDHLIQGGYFAEDRSGRQILHPLPSLSIGALVVQPEQFHSHHEVAGAMGNAKKEAKKIAGSALFVERRRYSTPKECS
jgi:EAL domain-containing protein (putative c-di-GMP-specific phosphodiesterase class I)/GGDEF domain-containing protein